jgi:hypothetical protein
MAAAVLGPILAYLMARRKTSGKVGTTEAETLWQENKDFRATLLSRNQALEARLDELLLEASSLHTEVLSLRAENRVLRLQLEEFQLK